MVIDTGQLPIFDAADVVVVGSGSAGAVAAIASARAGAETLLIERYGFLGGTSTMVLDSFYGFYPPGNDTRRMVGGIPWEIVGRLAKRGMMLERPNSYGAGTGVTYDPETLKVVWEETALEAGVRLRLHTFCTDVVMEDGRITNLVVDGKTGLGLIRAGMIVDASGDADICFHAAVPFQRAGEDGPAQSLTTTFRLGNVNVEQALAVKRLQLEELMRRANLGGQYRLPREEGLDNLLIAGRCLSATHDAHASVRSMGQCMAMGQAAGTAAALAVAMRQTPRQLSIQELQARLLSAGVLLAGARV